MSDRVLLERRRDKLFMAFGRLGIRRPVLVALILAVFTVLGGVFASQLSIDTSRFGLVDKDNWYQQRMFEFFADFGYPDAPVAIVAGGTAEQRREVVERFVAELEADERFAGRVMAKIGAETLAETALVARPGTLAELRASLPGDADVAGALEGGLVGVFGLLETQLYAALDGEVDVDPATAGGQLTRLSGFAQALAGKLAADAGEGPPVDEAQLFAALGDGSGEDPAAAIATEFAARGLDSEGYFVSNDGQHLLVAIFPEFGGDQVEDYEPVVERLREIRDGLDSGAVTLTFTGVPFLSVDEADALAVGLRRSMLATGGGILLLLLWAFRSLRRAVVALAPIAVGTVVSLGALYLIYGTLDTITSAFAAVLMGLAIDFSVHLLARYDEELRRGATRRTALFAALRKAGPGVATGAVTTALAFLTISTIEFTAYGRMGVITAIGLVVALTSALVLLPVLLGRGDLERHENPAHPLRSLRWLSNFVRRSPLVLLIVAITAALVGVSVMPAYNPRYLNLLPRSMESTRGLETLERDGAMTPWFAWVTAEDLDQARVFTAALRRSDTVARVESPTDLLPELDESRLAALRASFAGLEGNPDWSKLEAGPSEPAKLAGKVAAIVDALDELAFAAEQAGRSDPAVAATKQAFAELKTRLETLPPAAAKASLAGIEADMARVLGPAWATARRVAERGHWVPSDIPDLLEFRFLARDGSERLAIYAYPAGDVTSGANGNAAARRFTQTLEGIDARAAGQGISLYHHNQMILAGFKRASFVSICLVLVLLLLDFTSLRKALLALFPVLLGMGWMVGLFALIGLRLNVATIVVLPLMLGIGIDAGVHMMHRWELNSRAHRGRARLAEVVDGTGGAVILSSLTTMVGFAGLLVGKHLGMTQLGMAMVLGIGCSLLASVLVLPALLLLFDLAE